MQKPQYELGPLRESVLQHKSNILAFEKAIDKEKVEMEEVQGYIGQWEEYNRVNSDRPNS